MYISGEREKMLIGVVGFIGSGKGTVGDYLNEHYGFKKDSFAKPLKDCVSIIFGWSRELLEGDTDESRVFRERLDDFWSKVCGYNLTPRLALQLFGTECIREVFNENVWSESLVRRYRENGRPNTIVTDCRFKNEIKVIQDNGGQVWRVKRGYEPKWYDRYIEYYVDNNWYEIGRLREEGFFPHVSETDWIGANFDQVIDNDGSIDELYYKVDQVVTIDQVIDKFGG